MIRKSDVEKIKQHYNAEHDLGAEAPVPWHVYLLLEMIEDLQAQVRALQEAVPTGVTPAETIQSNADAKRYTSD